jgi:cell division protein FtsL
MSLLARRIRGFRLVDLVGVGVLMLLILGVYLAKTIAGRERAEIATTERQIEAEKARIRLLQAEVTHLEEPARIEHLSETYLGLAPVSIKHEASPDALSEIAIHPAAPSPKAEIEPAAAAAPGPESTR